MIKLAKTKTCKICAKLFTPFMTTAKVCGVTCSIIYAQRTREALQAKISRKAYKDTKEKLKTLTELANDAQQYVNLYCRKRDRNDGCISCDKPATWQGQWHASHYKSRGANSALRFNLYNLNKSCSVCNNHLSGNIGAYRPRLIAKIGLERVEWLDNHEKSRKYEREYLIRLKQVFMQMCKRKIISQS
jgi:hypothetical protein